MVVELRVTQLRLAHLRAIARASPRTSRFFDRARGRNISVYASRGQTRRSAAASSATTTTSRTTCVHYDLDVRFDPARLWVERPRVAARARQGAGGWLADVPPRRAAHGAVGVVTVARRSALPARRRPEQRASSACRSRWSADRARPSTSSTAAGSIRRASIARRSRRRAARQPTTPPAERRSCSPEPRFLYSNRVYWYPQAAVTDYATATMRLTVPSEYQVVASGRLVGSSLSPAAERCRPRPAPRSVRTVEYARRSSGALPRRASSAASCRSARRARRCRRRAGRADGWRRRRRPAGRRRRQPRGRLDAAHDRPQPSDCPRASPSILRFYATTHRRGAVPELHAGGARRQPAGRPQPGVLRRPAPAAADDAVLVVDDPVSFDSIYPNFFLAHEVAHQWWGQAVGWKNYHEQWLSEGLAQYFAALYAGSDRGPDTRRTPARQMRDSAMRPACAGPDLPRLPARPPPGATAASSAASSTTSPRSCCTCCGG